MSDWKAEFKKVIVDAMIAGGSPLDESTDVFGWQKPDWDGKLRKLVARREIDYTKTTYDESSWSEFVGTFEDNARKVGVDIKIYLKGRPEPIMWRYCGSVSDIITGVMTELGESK